MFLSLRGVARGGATLGAAAGIMLGAVACSSKPVPYKTPASQSAPATSTPASGSPAVSSPAAASPAVSQSPLPRATGQLTGTQLQTVLLPQSSFPAGFGLSSSSAVSSGGSLETAPATYDLATVSCPVFVQHLGNTGFGETAIAANSYTSQGQAFDQFVYQFATAGAASSFVSGIQSLARRCGSFTATGNGETGTFSLKTAAAPPVGGHPAIELLQAGKIGGSAVTLNTLLSASGVDVFGAATVGLGTAPPTSPVTSALAYDLMRRQAAAALLG
jgi:hypothetical protein